MTERSEHRPKVAMVTGASGFIGSHLVKILLNEGVKVRALVRKGDPLNNLYGLDIDMVEGDLLDVDSLKTCLEGCDTVFHFAAIYAYWLPDPNVMYKVNIIGTRNLLEASMAAGIKKVIYTSSIAAIGTLPEQQIADETTIFNNWMVADHYVMSKYMAELEALSFCTKGLDVVACNPTFPFGGNDIAPTPTGVLIQRYTSGKNPVWLPGGFNGVNVKDVAMGHWLACLRGRPGERYILGGHNLTYKELGMMVCEIAKVPKPKHELKTGLITFLGKINEWISDNITHKEPLIVDKAIQYTGGRYLWVDVSKAKRELGYDPGPIEVAIEESVDWFMGGRDKVLEQNHVPQLTSVKA